MRLHEMVAGWMTDNPVTIAPARPVVEAYALMAEHEVRHLPVVEGGKLVGILSDRDLHRATPLGRARAAGDVSAIFSMPVSEIMTREGLLTIDPLSTLREAADRMVGAKVSSLPVLEAGRLVGIVTSHDILRAVLGMERAKG